VDDYHDLYESRIPSVTSIDRISNIATLLFNTSNITQIPLFTSNLLSIYNPNGVDAMLLKNALNSRDLRLVTMRKNQLGFQ
jgi:hypothetical protein